MLHLTETYTIHTQQSTQNYVKVWTPLPLPIYIEEGTSDILSIILKVLLFKLLINGKFNCLSNNLIAGVRGQPNCFIVLYV